MIDIHHHCLPGVDDGPRTWDEAIAQCRMAHDEGIETIIATPHVLRGGWQNDSKDALRKLLSELNARLGGAPTVVEGCEYFFAHDMVGLLESNRAILPLAGSRFVLVEFAAHAIPPLIETVFYRLVVGGWVPIIAHPERNLVFQQRPALLSSLVEKGGKCQVTAMSITGEFGERARKASLEWIGSGLVHFVATDSHDVGKRSPRFREAKERVARKFGGEMAESLFLTNPAAVLKNEVLAFDPEPAGRAKGGLMSRVRRFFG